jgi:hypothetical protein
LRLLLSHPKKFGESEIGESRIAGELNEPLRANSFGKLLALFLGAHVAPDQRWAHYVTSTVQHHGSVHLARESNAGDLITAEPCLREGLANGDSGGSPPIFGSLLCPTNLAGSEGFVLLGCRSHNAPVGPQDKGASAASTDVNSENASFHGG